MVLSNRMLHAVILTTILFHKSLCFDHSQGKDQNDILYTSNHSCTKQLAYTTVEIRTHASKKRLYFEVRVKLCFPLMNTRSLKLVSYRYLLNYVYIALNHRINNHQITLRYLHGFDLRSSSFINFFDVTV